MGTDLSDELAEAVRAAGNPEDAIGKAGYFQVRPGGYGEGDEFAGVPVPQLRSVWDRLREVGQRDRAALDGFLDRYAREMPRTMLRYAIEKHSPEQRRRYRAGQA